MPDIPMPDPGLSYEEDWYAWTQDQAARLRAWPEALRPHGLDIANLAEEVADMGASQRRAVQSLLHQILVHLLKLEFHPATAPRQHWAAEAANFRSLLDIELRDSPSLRARRADFVAEAWPRALRQVRRQIEQEAPDILPLFELATESDQPRYAVDSELLNEDWFPGWR